MFIPDQFMLTHFQILLMFQISVGFLIKNFEMDQQYT